MNKHKYSTREKNLVFFIAAVITACLILMIVHSFNIVKLNSKKIPYSPISDPESCLTLGVGWFSPSPSPSPGPSPTPTPTPMPSPSPSPSPTPKPKPTPIIVNNEELDLLFSKYANEFGVDEQLLKYIAQCESKMNPNAVNGEYGGLFQFTASTWATTRQSMTADTNPDLRFNPEEAIKTSAFKISRGGINAWPSCNEF